MDSVVLANHRVKLKESKKIDKYLDLAKELKTVEHENDTVILIVLGALGMVPKDLEKRLGATEDQRKNQEQLKYKIEPWRPEKTLFHSDLNEEKLTSILYNFFKGAKICKYFCVYFVHF